MLHYLYTDEFQFECRTHQRHSNFVEIHFGVIANVFDFLNHAESNILDVHSLAFYFDVPCTKAVHLKCALTQLH